MGPMGRARLPYYSAGYIKRTDGPKAWHCFTLLYITAENNNQSYSLSL